MHPKIKHSKLRNTGLLYEFLIRQITADVLDKQNSNKALQIVKRKFNENTQLGKELALYNVIITKKFKSDKKADYFINEVLNERNKINSSQLRREKYNIIKQLKEEYDLNKFLGSKVNHYRVYASIFKLFEFSDSLTPSQKTESFFNLVEHITTKNHQLKLGETIGGAQIPKDEDLRILTYKTLLEKFNEKYSNLNLPQKSLLRAYINNISNTNSLREYFDKVVPALKKEIKKYSKNLKDEVVKIKLQESIKYIDKFTGIKGKSISFKDSNVEQVLRYMELLKELKKSGNKNKKVL